MKHALRSVFTFAAIVLVSPNFVQAAGECDDNPNPCFAPRSWIEDFDEDPLIASPGDWQRRNGTSPQPTYQDGKAFFDGTQNAWTLIDSADHYFVGNTTVNIVMDENPGGPGDSGAGWWINMDNEAVQGGHFKIFGVLARNDNGEQVYRFGQASNAFDEEIVLEDGPMSAEVFLLPPEDGVGDMGVAYSITDSSEQVFDGFFEIPSRNSPIEDRWLTVFSMGAGQGIIDYIEVHNQPTDLVSCDIDGDGFCDIIDIDQLVGGIIGGSNDSSLDVNGDGTVDHADLDDWRSVAGTENGFAGPYLEGDSDLSGMVGAGDLNNVALGWTGSPNTWSGGDFTADGKVDAADLNVLGLNWQASTPLAAQAVPEPAAGMLLLLALSALASRRRTKFD